MVCNFGSPGTGPGQAQHGGSQVCVGPDPWSEERVVSGINQEVRCHPKRLLLWHLVCLGRGAAEAGCVPAEEIDPPFIFQVAVLPFGLL